MKKPLTFTFIILITSINLVFSQQTKPAIPEMIHVEGGTFMMGNSLGNKDEQPVHKVAITSFYFGKYEVTRKDFKKFIEATGYITDAEKPDSVNAKHGLPPRGVNNGSWKVDAKGMSLPETDSMKPVGNVSWYDAVAYLSWLSKETGKKFRLPTEAEWEYAAKGGMQSKGYKYVGGNNLGEVAWFIGNSDKRGHTVGQKLPNELGIYDMAGNAREWCSDWYGESYYKVSPGTDPAGPDHGKNRVVRGGSWGSEEDRMRISYRNEAFPYNSALDFGFRPSMTDDAAVKKAAEPKSDLMKDFDTKGFIDIYGIYFDVNKYVVKPESYAVIDQITKYLQENPKTRIVIEGHTDSQGGDKLNQPLSENRAKAIKAEIVKRGIDTSRMETLGFGASKPVADNKTAAGRTQNRRVTIKKL
jgi:formylglycine-generating enzyme required for sulfatase activity